MKTSLRTHFSQLLLLLGLSGDVRSFGVSVFRGGGVNGCSCFLCPVASGATQVWLRRYPPRRPQWTGPSGVWMTPACRCPLILLTSSTEWSPCSGGWLYMLLTHTHSSGTRLSFRQHLKCRSKRKAVPIVSLRYSDFTVGAEVGLPQTTIQ